MKSAEQRLPGGGSPVTVAITGSFGKTTTKLYVRHLVAGQRSVLASPASFNNTGGLARTLNEHLTPGTEVFVAEMGTYGPGEIRKMCAWVQPSIGVIVNIGPVHLERMRSLDGVVKAKAEITEGVDRPCSTSAPTAWPSWPTSWPRAASGRAGGHRAGAGADVVVIDDGEGNLEVGPPAPTAIASRPPPHRRPTWPPPSGWSWPSVSTCPPRWPGSTRCPSPSTARR